MTKYLTNKQHRAAKSRLTRAVNSGDPSKVIAEVDRTYAEWDRGNYVYPDDWHRWERARDDAYYALRFAS